MPDGSCQQLNAWQCEAAGGTFIGPGLACTPGICDPCTDCDYPCTECPKAYPQGYNVTFKAGEVIAGGNTSDAGAIAAARARVDAVTFSSSIYNPSNGFFEPGRAVEVCPYGRGGDCITRECVDYNNGEWFLYREPASPDRGHQHGGSVEPFCGANVAGVRFYGGEIWEYFTTSEMDDICNAGVPIDPRTLRWQLTFEPAPGWAQSGPLFKKITFPDPCKYPVPPVVFQAEVYDIDYSKQNPEGTMENTRVRMNATITLIPIPYTP